MKSFKDQDKAIQMIVDRTNGICHSPDSLVERLQQLLDLPCAICKDGVVLEEQEQKLKRGAVLLYNAIVYMEEMIGGSIENTRKGYRGAYSRLAGSLGQRNGTKVSLGIQYGYERRDESGKLRAFGGKSTALYATHRRSVESRDYAV